MKTTLVVSAGIAFVLAATFILRAQTTATFIQTLQSGSAAEVEAMAAAIESMTPVAAESVPPWGTFWSVEHPDWPPLPGNINDLPAWDLGSGVYLLADQDFDYAALEQQDAAVHLLARTMGLEMDSQYVAGSSYTIDTDALYLEITGVSNGTAGFNLNNGNNQVYCIWSTTNLAMPFAGWQVETEVWPTNSAVMPFTVPTLARPNLFVRAQDWTDVLGDGGIPLWWYWLYFGRTDLLATNLNSVGSTLLFDYTNNIDPNVLVFSIVVTNRYVNTSTPVPASGPWRGLGV